MENWLHTFERFDKLIEETGFTIKYIWAIDWKDYTKGITKTPKIHTYNPKSTK